MRVSILTSSRADFGIYLPLVKLLNKDSYFNLNLIVFGTHLSKDHGYTVNNIIEHGFKVNYKLKTLLGDNPHEISMSMSLTMKEFSKVWKIEKDKTDLIICLGDRYEMFAAVSASVPFNIPIAHIHGGETTLGSIDNIFRHSLTLMSKYHFTSTESHLKKVVSLTQNKNNVFNIGSLSLDNQDQINLYSKSEFKTNFNIDFSKPTILVTFHPETLSYEKNKDHSIELSSALREVRDFQIVITMPNSDTRGSIIRECFIKLRDQCSHIISVENLGSKGYFSAMKYCKFLLGNSSSGIIEAASFKKYVINLGARQEGRLGGKNIINIKIKKSLILQAVEKLSKLGEFNGSNPYKGKQPACEQLIKVLKVLK